MIELFKTQHRLSAEQDPNSLGTVQTPELQSFTERKDEERIAETQEKQGSCPGQP